MTYLSPEWRRKLLDAGFPAEELKLGVAEEILRRLPKTFTYKHETVWLECCPISETGDPCRDWLVRYMTVEVRDAELRLRGNAQETVGDTLANAAAAMTCYLVEQGLLEHKLLPNP